MRASVFLKCIIFSVKNSRDSEVNEDCFVVVVDHDVVWLDISVDDVDDLVAVVKRLKHVDEVQPHLLFLESYKFLQVLFVFVLDVVILKLLV